MGRPPKVKIAPAEAPTPAAETPATEADTPVRRRRRRRTTTPTPPDYAQETVLIVEAALRSRGSKGATSEILSSVVGWARSVRAEGEELRVINSRPRRTKNQAPVDRTTTYEMNRALLDGILTGGVTIDVQDDGQLIFLSTAVSGTGAGMPMLSSDTSGDGVADDVLA